MHAELKNILEELLSKHPNKTPVPNNNPQGPKLVTWAEPTKGLLVWKFDDGSYSVDLPGSGNYTLTEAAVRKNSPGGGAELSAAEVEELRSQLQTVA